MAPRVSKEGNNIVISCPHPVTEWYVDIQTTESRLILTPDSTKEIRKCLEAYDVTTLSHMEHAVERDIPPIINEIVVEHLRLCGIHLTADTLEQTISAAITRYFYSYGEEDR